jgi:chromate reductase, NAD(P)H dehydrogenase (quinone)
MKVSACIAVPKEFPAAPADGNHPSLLAMKILAFSGSLRPLSHNTALLHALAKMMPADSSYKVWEGVGTLPHFSPEIDFDASPGPVIAYRALLKSADAVIICTPEYAFGMPGVLKNALDWAVSSGELDRKAVGTISASPLPSGGEKAHAWLNQTLTALGANQIQAAKLSVAGIKVKMTASGEITDEQLAKDLETFLYALIAGINTSTWQ